MSKHVVIGEQATHPLSHNNIIQAHQNEFVVPGS